MSSAPALSLSIRRRGDSTWVDLDPASEQGARVMQDLGVRLVRRDEHPMMEEKEMTATAAAVRHDRPLRPVEGVSEKERFAYALRVREQALAMMNRVTTVPRRWAGKIARALRLDKAWALVKEGLGWAREKAAWLGNMLGVTGMVGLGMTALSTSSGRSAVGYALKPVGWALGAVGWGLNVIKSGLNHLGRPGRWMAERIDDAEVFAGRKLLSTSKWVDKRLGAHLKTDSTAMRTTRLAGVLLVAQRAITAFGLPMPLVYLIGAATAIWGVYDATDIAMKVGQDRGWLKVTEDETTGAKRATGTAKVAVSTPGAHGQARQGGGQGKRGH